jgi:hypothetical protein
MRGSAIVILCLAQELEPLAIAIPQELAAMLVVRRNGRGRRCPFSLKYCHFSFQLHVALSELFNLRIRSVEGGLKRRYARHRACGRSCRSCAARTCT